MLSDLPVGPVVVNVWSPLSDAGPLQHELHRGMTLSQWPFLGGASVDSCPGGSQPLVMMVWMSLCCLIHSLPRILCLNCIFHFGRMCWYCKSSKNLQYFLYIVLFHFGRVFQKIHHCGFPAGPNGSSLELVVPQGHQCLS